MSDLEEFDFCAVGKTPQGEILYALPAGLDDTIRKALQEPEQIDVEEFTPFLGALKHAQWLLSEKGVHDTYINNTLNAKGRFGQPLPKIEGVDDNTIELAEELFNKVFEKGSVAFKILEAAKAYQEASDE